VGHSLLLLALLLTLLLEILLKLLTLVPGLVMQAYQPQGVLLERCCYNLHMETEN